MTYTHFGRFNHYHSDPFQGLFHHTHEVPHGWDDAFFVKPHDHIDVDDNPRTYLGEENRRQTAAMFPKVFYPTNLERA